ncbi:MAG: hypothetical protein PVG39_00560 [Desulfobacteraceae bacterium]|jgi:hypothetical protein
MAIEKKKIKPYDETHQDGIISIEQDMKISAVHGDFGIQIAEDGRIWICMNGQALIRFKPFHNKYDSMMNSTSYTCKKCNQIVFAGQEHKCKD